VDPTIEAVQKGKMLLSYLLKIPGVEDKNRSFSLGLLFQTHPPISQENELLRNSSI